MIRATITVSGITPQQFVLKVLLFMEAATVEMNKLGDQTVLAIRKVISHERKRGSSRSGDRLAKSIRGYEASLPLAAMYGIGKISVMNSLAPYWRVVNYGGIVPPMSYGSFGAGSPPDSALTGKGTQPWNEVTGGTATYYFRMKPKTSIRPMNYIEKTVAVTKAGWAPFWKLKFYAIWLSLPTPPPVP